jgi:hypothetical protein
MYRILLRQRPTSFAFLSGLMVSMATSAAAQIAFAEKSPPNQLAVLSSGGLALAAGVCWFLLSENIDAAGRTVDSHAVVMKGREAAFESLPRHFSVAGISFFLLAAGFSAMWPWPAEIAKALSWVQARLLELVS